MKKAGTLVVGNEILLGKTRDTNTLFLAEVLLKKGIRLERWVTVPDRARDIIRELKRFLDDGFRLIVVSGGMGPTHDDITVKAVAEGLGLRLEFNRSCFDRMVSKWRSRNPGKDLPPNSEKGLTKMAHTPEDFDLVNNENGMVEGLVGVVDRGRTTVFILPGVPSEYKGIVSTRKFQDYIPSSGEGDVVISEVAFGGRESQIADILDEVQSRFPDIEIGSYPQGRGRVVVRFTGSSDGVDKASLEIREMLSEIAGDPKDV